MTDDCRLSKSTYLSSLYPLFFGSVYPSNKDSRLMIQHLRKNPTAHARSMSLPNYPFLVPPVRLLLSVSLISIPFLSKSLFFLKKKTPQEIRVMPQLYSLVWRRTPVRITTTDRSGLNRRTTSIVTLSHASVVVRSTQPHPASICCASGDPCVFASPAEYQPQCLCQVSLHGSCLSRTIYILLVTATR